MQLYSTLISGMYYRFKPILTQFIGQIQAAGAFGQQSDAFEDEGHALGAVVRHEGGLEHARGYFERGHPFQGFFSRPVQEEHLFQRGVQRRTDRGVGVPGGAKDAELAIQVAQNDLVLSQRGEARRAQQVAQQGGFSALGLS